MNPHRLAALLVGVAALCVMAGVVFSGAREFWIVVGLFFALLAGGVLNWDRRGGRGGH